MDHLLIYLVPIFLVVAVIYSMIGQGGGSAYLAILALFNVPYNNLPSVALSCNVFATIVSVYHFYRAGYLKFRLIIPFLITSVPAAFIGGTISIPEKPFKIVLMCLLVIIALRTFFWNVHPSDIKFPSVKVAYTIGPLIGIVLGLLAGIVGIGGGIFLMPIIISLRWGSVKEGAVAGGLLTLLNSISGLIGHGAKGMIDWKFLLPLVIATVIGSQIGAHLGAKKLPSNVIQKIFAIILFAVALRLSVQLLRGL